MNRIPPIKAVMTPFPTSIDIADSLQAALAMMQEHEIRHLPVTEQGQLVSVITDRDIRLAIEPSPRPGGGRRGRGAVGHQNIRLSDGYGTASVYATFSEPGEYLMRARVDNFNSSDSSSGDQCCWTNAYIRVTVTP